MNKKILQTAVIIITVILVVSITASEMMLSTTTNKIISSNKDAYNITFQENGLLFSPTAKNGTLTTWSVTLNNTTKYSTTNTIIFNEINGTYLYSADTNNTMYTSTFSGSVTVNGTATVQFITFSLISNYTVIFTETGLPAGTVWHLNVTKEVFKTTPSILFEAYESGLLLTNHLLLNTTLSYYSSANTISLNEYNGRYLYIISTNNTQYVPTLPLASFTINGTNYSRVVSFSLYSKELIQLNVSKTILDPVWAAFLGDIGMTVFIFNITLTYIGNGILTISPWDFSMITTNGSVPYVFSANMTNPFPPQDISLSSGQSISKQIAFETLNDSSVLSVYCYSGGPNYYAPYIPAIS